MHATKQYTSGTPPLFVSTTQGALETRSRIEVAHFRYFVFERRGSLSPNPRNANLDFETKMFSRLGPWGCSPRCNLSFFAEASFRVRYGAP